MTGEGRIDRAALATLLETTGDDPEFLAELIDSFFDDSPVQLATIRQAAQGGDAEGLRRAAHSLKSNSATFGATELANLCRQLEQLGRDGDLAAIGDLVARTEAEYGRVRPALLAARDAM